MLCTFTCFLFRYFMRKDFTIIKKYVKKYKVKKYKVKKKHRLR